MRTKVMTLLLLLLLFA